MSDHIANSQAPTGNTGSAADQDFNPVTAPQRPVRPRKPEQSTFVTVIGAISMAFGILGLVGGLGQMMLMPVMIDTFASHPEAADMVGFMRAMFWSMAIVGLLMSAFITWASWALIQRKNWARIAFMVMSALSALGSVLFVPLFLFAAFATDASELQGMGGMVQAMQTAMAVLALVNLGVSVWVLVRLASEPIRAEFGVARPSRSRSLAS